jgi:sec-independent protein translocase protein TatB
MLNLDPGKLIVIAVVAIILLGPDKLPQFARQVGGAWRSFNDFRHRMESEVRSTMPDLPPTSEIARLARSPSALLNHLSNLPSEDDEAPDGSYQPPTVPANGVNGAGEAAPDGAGGAGGDLGETSADGDDVGTGGVTPDGGPAEPPTPAIPATNGRPSVAPQPADVAVPADPTLN